jgi:myosin heavy subunit
MNRMSAFAGAVASLVLVAVGCGSDQAATELAEANNKLNAATKETGDLREQLKKSQAATIDAIAKSSDLTKRLATANDQAIEIRNESESNRQAVEQLQREIADLKTRLTAAEQANRAAETAGSRGRDGDDPETKLAAATDGRRTTEQILAARDFHFEKVTFKTTRAEFTKLDRKLENNTEKSKIGESTYEFHSDQIGTIKVTFLDSNIQTIDLLYGEHELEELGGPRTIEKRLVAKFGEPDSDEDHSAKWFFTSADRFILAITSDSGNAIGVTFGKVSLVAERNGRIQKLDAGF